MLDERFVLVGAALSVIGMVQYLRAMAAGAARPNRVTWFCWALAPFVAFVAEVGAGVGLRSAMTFVVGFTPLVIFLASFASRDAYWRLGPADVACGALSVAAIAGWAVTRSGTVAIALAVAADAVAGIPTLRKAWRHPESEEPLVFTLAMVNALIALLTVDRWTTADVAFPLNIVVVAGVLTAVTYGRRGRA